jgi:hypothetical protein
MRSIAYTERGLGYKSGIMASDLTIPEILADPFLGVLYHHAPEATLRILSTTPKHPGKPIALPSTSSN